MYIFTVCHNTTVLVLSFLQRDKEKIKILLQSRREFYFRVAKVNDGDCSKNYFSKVTLRIELWSWISIVYIIVVNVRNVIKTSSVKLRSTYLYAFLRYCLVAFLGEVLSGVIIVYHGYAVYVAGVWISS